MLEPKKASAEHVNALVALSFQIVTIFAFSRKSTFKKLEF
jgi:hypothetical protein